MRVAAAGATMEWGRGDPCPPAATSAAACGGGGLLEAKSKRQGCRSSTRDLEPERMTPSKQLHHNVLQLHSNILSERRVPAQNSKAAGLTQGKSPFTSRPGGSGLRLAAAYPLQPLTCRSRQPGCTLFAVRCSAVHSHASPPQRTARRPTAARLVARAPPAAALAIRSQALRVGRASHWCLTLGRSLAWG